MIHSQIITLTKPNHGFILNPLPQKTEDGICSPHNGPIRPRSSVVFLCPPKTQAALRRLISVMAGCIGQPLKRLAGSIAGTANLIQSATQRFAAMGGGLSIINGVPAMAYAQNAPQVRPVTPRQSLFNLIKRTPQGNRIICTDLTYAQAAALVAEMPAFIVKFARMEVVA